MHDDLVTALGLAVQEEPGGCGVLPPVVHRPWRRAAPGPVPPWARA
ncbi:MAG TPA: hypothetical protein VFB73_02455 [Chloroflexota bacterium]|nr:hypothetical protein [Chloroflexota bacterium]